MNYLRVFLLIFIMNLSCHQSDYMMQYAIVSKVEFVLSTFGFSSRGSKNFYKQKLTFEYYTNEGIKKDSIIIGRKYGLITKGDTLVLKIYLDKNRNIEIENVILSKKLRKNNNLSSNEAIEVDNEKNPLNYFLNKRNGK
jgi:hypothetical protein